MTTKMKKITAGKNLNSTYPSASIKEVQATEEFSPQKRTSSTSKYKFHNFFLWVIFALLDPDPDTDPLTWLNPDPKHCFFLWKIGSYEGNGWLILAGFNKVEKILDRWKMLEKYPGQN
jgi:hypothetical protein